MTYNPLPAEVQAAIEYLLRVAEANKIIVAGFAFSSEPIRVANFGNCSDCAEAKLYTGLCGIAKEKRERGLIQHDRVGMVQ